jgi:hypothetical protein
VDLPLAPTSRVSSAAQLRRFTTKLVLLVPLPLLVVMLNLVVDPIGLFHDRHQEREYAALLLDGHNVIAGGGTNDRLVVRHYVAGLKQGFDVALLGSSRSMPIHAAAFPGRSFFNFSLGGAHVRDHIALYAMLRERQLPPRTLVLNLDPWLLNRNGANTWWVTLEPEYREGLATLVANSRAALLLDGVPVPRRYLRAASLQYFRFSLLVVKDRLVQGPTGPPFTPTDRRYDTNFVQWADGSYGWPEAARRATIPEIREAAIRYAMRGTANYLGGFTELDDRLQGLLEAFLRAVRRDGVRLALILTPYHPAAYPRLVASPRYRLVADAERYYRELASREGIPLVGSYDPSRHGFGEGDFYDASHATDAALEQWLSTERLP